MISSARHCIPPPSGLPVAHRGGLFISSGWSSPVARRARNPKVAGSNPAPATKLDAVVLLAMENAGFS